MKLGTRAKGRSALKNCQVTPRSNLRGRVRGIVERPRVRIRAKGLKNLGKGRRTSRFGNQKADGEQHKKIPAFRGKTDKVKRQKVASFSLPGRETADSVSSKTK